MRKPILLALAGLFSFSAFAQHVVWFDKPNSLKGRAAWFSGRTAEVSYGNKPIDAGQFGNADPEWERRSLPLGNGSIGANVMGSIDV